MRPRPRKIIFFLLAGGGVLLLLLLSAGAWLYFRFPAEWAGKKAAELARERSGWRFQIGPISPFPLGRFHVGALSVESPDGEPAFRWKGLAARYGVSALRGKAVVLHDLTLDEPELFLRRRNGVWNLKDLADRLVPPAPEPSPGPLDALDWDRIPLDRIWEEVEKALRQQGIDLPRLRVNRFFVDRLRLTVDDGAGSVLALPPLDLRASLSLAPEAEANLSLEVESGEAPEAFALNFALRLDLRGARFSVEKAELRLGRQISGRLKMELARFGLEKLEAEGSLKVEPGSIAPPLDRFLTVSPSGPLAGGLPKVAAAFRLAGRIDASTLEEIKERASRLALPLRMELDGKLEASDFPAALFPPGASLRSGKAELVARALEKDLRVRSSLALKSLKLPPPQTGGVNLGLLDLRHEGELALEEFKRLRLSRFTLSIPPLGMELRAAADLASTAEASALTPHLGSEARPIRRLRETLSGDLSASLLLNAPRAGGIAPDVKLGGRAEGALRISKKRADRFSVEISPAARDFSLSTEGWAVRNLNLRFPLSKTILLGPAARSGSVPAGAIWAKDYVAELRPLSPYRNAVQIGRLEAGGYALEEIEVDAGFDGTNFVVDRLAAELLGGSLWGRLALLPSGRALRVTGALEALDLDVSKLTGRPTLGDARVSADLRGGLAVRTEGKLSAETILDELEAKFHLTRVGEKTLEELLVFLDPKGEDPSFVQARGLLRNPTIASSLRNPQLHVSVSHGVMDADLRLPNMKFVDLSVPIRGISVKKLMTFEALRRTLDRLAPLLAYARYLRLTGIDDDGSPVFAPPSKEARQ